MTKPKLYYAQGVFDVMFVDTNGKSARDFLVKEITDNDALNLVKNSLKVVEIKNQKQIPSSWANSLPWNQEEFMNDDNQTCKQVLATLASEDWKREARILELERELERLRNQ